MSRRPTNTNCTKNPNFTNILRPFSIRAIRVFRVIRVQLLLGGLCAAALLFADCGRQQPPPPAKKSAPTPSAAAQAPQGAGAASSVPSRAVEEYALVRTVDSGVRALHGITLDAQDNLYVAGASGVKTWSADGKLLREWSPSGPATCIALDGEGNAYVGEQARIEVFDREGKLRNSWGKEGRDAGELNCVTAIAVFPGRAGSPVTDILVADAGNRCIHRFDMTGDFVEDIGKPDRDAGVPGLVCPSAHLDVAADASGVLHVTNPGLTRVERYSLDGRLLGFWGEGGNEPQQFSGCCNPTNIALLPDGRVATAEKITARVKIYDANGKMLAFLGPQYFTKGAAGLGLAVDSAGRLWAMDPGDGKVRVFERKKSP